jgi:hypothetical protein
MKQKLISCLSDFSLFFFALLNVADSSSVEPILRKALQSHSLNDELPVVIHLSDTVKTD